MIGAAILLAIAALIYAPGVIRILRGTEVDRLLAPKPPLPQRAPRLASEWDRITAFQMQARADISASEDFAAWEAEVSA